LRLQLFAVRLIYLELPLRSIAVTNYTQLLDAIRRRKDELNVSFEILDAVSGLQSGYSAKLLSPRPVKRLGEVSLAALLGALGLRLVVRPDPDALSRVRSRLVPRQASPIHRVRARTPMGATAAARDSISSATGI
jgi:hypothetical protein